MIRGNRLIAPTLIYLIAFYSTFKNASIYLLGNRQFLILLIDYLFLILLVIVSAWLILKIILLSKKVINKKIIYVVPLLIWVIIVSSILTLFIDGNYIPRNLITSFLALIIIVLGISDKNTFIKTVLSFGLGGLLSAALPLLLFPELIGVRSATIDGVFYRGGVWNYVLITFVSVGWIILALVKHLKSKTIRVLIYLAFFVMWISAFAGLSRTLLVLTVISLLIFALTSNRIRLYMQTTIAILLALLLINLLMPTALDSVRERFNLSQESINDEPRTQIWAEYLSHISEYYLIGYIGNYRDIISNSSLAGAGPHSVFLNWLVQYGLVGLVGFLYLLLGVFKNILKIKKVSSYEFSCLLAWFASYITLASINQTGFVEMSFFVSFGIVLKWSLLYSEK